MGSVTVTKVSTPVNTYRVQLSPSADLTLATTYALFYLQPRGPLMIDPQTKVYAGMIIGQHTRENDLEVNVREGKKLSNVRAAGKDDALILTPPMRMTLERAMSYIQDDELVEITPQSIRLRKRWLDPNVRKRNERAAG